jgi:ABC-2 type transport system permease protein
MTFTIARTEFRRLFGTPLAWSILALLQFILALLFLIFVQSFLTQIQPHSAGLANAPGVTDYVLTPLFMWASIFMLGVMPLLTMRSFADERAHGTLTLLSSAPIASTHIVLGKFLSLVFFIIVMLAMLMLMPLSLTAGTHLDWGKLAAGLLGLFLLLGSFAAAGIYISSLTAQPIIAAVSTFGLLLFLVILYISGASQGSSSALFLYLSHFSHFLNFLNGNFDSSDLVYYLLFMLTFLVLAIRRLDQLRFKP